MYQPFQPQGSVVTVDSVPAPLGGWNARDALSSMDPMDAVIMQNIFPTTSNVELRGGSTNYATGMSGNVNTLLTYSGGSASKFFAIDGNNSVFDISSPGAVGSAVVTGLANNYWEYANITTAGGGFLLMCNGLDSVRSYNGSTWSTPSITGVTSSTLDNIVLFKGRLWFCQKSTLTAWYLPTDSIAGAASEFDLTAVARQGGYIVDMGTWTIDAGYGVDDNLVFITSNGEVIVYAGTDPASSTTWSLIGVWQLGAPIGHRCLIKYGGDILILSYDGLAPLAQALQSSRLDPRVNLSDKIQGAITYATTAYSTGPTSTGWQIIYYPVNNAIILNVPGVNGAGTSQQYVMNTITKSWCNFTNWNANVFELFNNNLYFGAGNGTVLQAWDGTYSDNGVEIPGVVVQAFNYFGQRGTFKQFTRGRPTIYTNGQPNIYMTMNTDYDLTATNNAVSYTQPTVAEWDSALWDVSKWGAGLTLNNGWQGTPANGYCGAIRFCTKSAGVQIQWASTDIVFMPGWAGI